MPPQDIDPVNSDHSPSLSPEPPSSFDLEFARLRKLADIVYEGIEEIFSPQILDERDPHSRRLRALREKHQAVLRPILSSITVLCWYFSTCLSSGSWHYCAFTMLLIRSTHMSPANTSTSFGRSPNSPSSFPFTASCLHKLFLELLPLPPYRNQWLLLAPMNTSLPYHGLEILPLRFSMSQTTGQLMGFEPQSSSEGLTAALTCWVLLLHYDRTWLPCTGWSMSHGSMHASHAIPDPIANRHCFGDHCICVGNYVGG